MTPSLPDIALLASAPALGALLVWVHVRVGRRGDRARRRREAAAQWERFALRRKELRVSIDADGSATLHGLAGGVKWSLARRPWGRGTRLVLRARVCGVPRADEALARIPGAEVDLRDGALCLATTLEEWELDDAFFDAVRAVIGGEPLRSSLSARS